MPLDRFSAAWRESYIVEATERARKGDGGTCVFCRLAGEDVSVESGVLCVTPWSFVCLNAFPYGSGHLLVLPRRHVAGLDELTTEESDDLFRTVRATASKLRQPPSARRTRSWRCTGSSGASLTAPSRDWMAATSSW